MPYILVRGNLASYGHKYPWRVLVSGLKGTIYVVVTYMLLSLIMCNRALLIIANVTICLATHTSNICRNLSHFSLTVLYM